MKSFLASLSLSVLMFCVIPAQAEEEQSYQLEQIKKMSQSNSATPGEEVAPATETTDLLADTDLEKLSKPETDFSNVRNMKPSFEKPKLEMVKPQL